MSWIKRNLYFLIGGVIALILMGLSGWYLYSKWQLNNEMVEKLNQQYQVLQQLNNQNPHPGSRDVDNIKAAREQQTELRDFIKTTRKHFQAIQPIPPAPDKGKLSDQAFSTALSRTIDQMQRDATNASVNLPVLPPPSDKYSFSFESEKQKMGFPPGSLEPLSVQLGEVKAICDVLFAAKINSLDSLRRERVTTDESQASLDFLSEKSVTNDMGVLTPYELSFRCFTPELAAVLAGFANSPYGMLVRSVNVEVAAETPVDINAMTTATAAPVAPTYVPPANPVQQRMNDEAAFRARYGLGPRGRYGEGGRGPAPPPVVTPQPVQPAMPVAPATQGKGGLQTVLDERQLKVNMMLVVVKLASTPAK